MGQLATLADASMHLHRCRHLHEMGASMCRFSGRRRSGGVAAGKGGVCLTCALAHWRTSISRGAALTTRALPPCATSFHLTRGKQLCFSCIARQSAAAYTSPVQLSSNHRNDSAPSWKSRRLGTPLRPTLNLSVRRRLQTSKIITLQQRTQSARRSKLRSAKSQW